MNSSKGLLTGIWRRAYSRAVGESSASPFSSLDMAQADFLRRGFAAPGERFNVPGSTMVVRWVRVRGSGVVAGSLLRAYIGRTGTFASATAADATTASTLLISDVGEGILSTTGGTGLGQHRSILDSDEAASASKLTIATRDMAHDIAAGSTPEAFSPVPDATTTFRIYCPWEVAPTSAATDLVTAVALGTVTDGNWTLVVEEGLAPTLCVGSTDALVANGVVVPSGTAGTAKGMIGTPANATAAMTEASRQFGRSLDAYSGSAALRLVDLFGRFKQ